MSTHDIRDAVARGDYAAASVRLGEYARSLEANEESLRELAALLEWTRVTILCAKAHAEDRLGAMWAEVQALAAYRR